MVTQVPEPQLSNPVLVSLTKKQILSELYSLGFGIREIAHMLDVTHKTAHQWKYKHWPISVSRTRLEEVLAVCWRLQNGYKINEVAAWLITPLHEWAPISASDLVADRRYDLVLTLAENRKSNAEEVLDQFEPEWRDKYNSGWEIVISGDGHPSFYAPYGKEEFIAPDGLPSFRAKPAPR